LFFSEEQNQKTFIFSIASTFQAMAGTFPLAQNQTSFATFLQKGRIFSELSIKCSLPGQKDAP
jgi:hypothetical protein